MKKEILHEMDKIIFEEKGKVSFRKIANNLEIAPSTISYQFQNQDNLYKEYLLFKLSKLVSVETLSSFDNLILALGNEIYIIFQATASDITFEMINALLRSLLVSNFEILDLLFASTYGEADRDKELAIISNVIIAMVFPENYALILNNDLTIEANREKLMKNIIKREVNDVR